VKITSLLDRFGKTPRSAKTQSRRRDRYSTPRAMLSQPASRSRLITMLRAVGEELRGRAGPYLGAVLVKRPVPHVMLTVFRFPVAAVAGQQVGGVGLPGGEAGDPVHGLGFAQRVPVQVVDLPVDAEFLVDAGEVQAGDAGGGPDGADLDPAVAAVKGDVVRGKSPVRGADGEQRRSSEGMLPFTVRM
jgi:hypothetical protein